MRHLISILDLSQDDFDRIIESSAQNSLSDKPSSFPLLGKSIGLEFRKTSTRTRTSFASAAVKLGACPIIFGTSDLQVNTGESLKDTIKVLSQYLEMLIIRTASDPAELVMMSQESSIPIINAMTSDEHPTQALSDISMMRKRFGNLNGLNLLYCGEGNSTAVALAFAIARTTGMHATFLTPPGYGIPADALQKAKTLQRKFGGSIHHSHEIPASLVGGGFDIFYTARWQTTGTTKPDHGWREIFAPYRITESLFSRLRNGPSSVFMHDLPAVRGEECDAAVLDGPNSIAIEQAKQKMFAAMAIIEWCSGTQR